MVQDAKQVLRANRSFCDLWNVPEELIESGNDRNLLRWVTDQVADPIAFLAEVERLYASSEESVDVIRVADGRVIERYSWPLSSQGMEGGRIWVFRDITDRHRKDAELRKLGRAVEQSSSTVVITDLEGRIEYVNRAFEETTGHSREEAIGQTPAITSSGEQSAEFYRDLWETITAGRQWQGEFQNRRKDGKFYWQSATISPVVDEDGVTRHYVSVQEDVTEKRRVADELQTYAAALEEANQTLRDYSAAVDAATQAKSEFLANMSHEIRTPMTAILGYSDILLNDGQQQSHGERVEAIQTIQRNGQYLLDLINDILDLSKIEAGKLELETVECSPVQVVSDAVSLMQVRADAKNLNLEVRYEGLIPTAIQTDPLRLRQVLINLLGNAVKFTELGTVTLKVHAPLSLGGSPRLLFEISDTGIGMTPEQTKTLFQPFQQADTSTSRRFGGTGLGLTISKRLAEKLGGDITLTSRYGEGSIFTLAIDPGPLDNVCMANVTDSDATGQAAPDEPTSIAKELSCRILLAEDGHDNQRLIAFLLRKTGAEVDVAENGQIAFEKAVQAQSAGCPYDVILMDMQMPVMDGYQATRELRESGYTRPVVALTANAMAGDRDKCLAAGCDEFATKPIDRRALLETVNAVLVPADAAPLGH